MTTATSRQPIVDGAYWLRKPGPNAEVIVAYTGAVAPEAIDAVGLWRRTGVDIGLLAVTSPDRLNAGWTAAQRARERGRGRARCAYRAVGRRCRRIAAIVTVLDGHPATLSLARRGASGHRARRWASSISARPDRCRILYRH